jgi:hypothetical protein
MLGSLGRLPKNIASRILLSGLLAHYERKSVQGSLTARVVLARRIQNPVARLVFWLATSCLSSDNNARFPGKAISVANVRGTRRWSMISIAAEC